MGGAITGFLVSAIVLKNVVKLQWENKMRKICMGLIPAIFVVIFLINVAAWDYYPKEEWNFSYKMTYDLYEIRECLKNDTCRNS